MDIKPADVTPVVKYYGKKAFRLNFRFVKPIKNIPSYDDVLTNNNKICEKQSLEHETKLKGG